MPTNILPNCIAGIFTTAGCERDEGERVACHLLSAGCLTDGGTWGPIPGGKHGRIANGTLSIYFSPGTFGTSGFSGAGHGYAHHVRASRPADVGSEVLIPGEPEIRTRDERLRNGIPLQVETWVAICDTARGLGLNPPALVVPNA